MGFRFRRSIRLANGVRLSLSKRGTSLSIGKPGATVNFGPRGTRTTIGAPGTGLFYTTKPTRSGGRGGVGAAVFRFMQVVYLALAIVLGYFAIGVFLTAVLHRPWFS